MCTSVSLCVHVYVYRGTCTGQIKDLFLLFMCISVSLCVHVYVYGGTCTGQKSVTDFPGAKVTGGCEPRDVVAGNRSQVL